MTFQLHSNLISKLFVMDLPLSRVLLEDERNYPWLLLVPRKPNVQRIMDLTAEDQLQLLQELDSVQRIMWETFSPTQLNVAAIGNKTPQLHIHVIARYENDPAWPHTVWDHSIRARYTDEEKTVYIEKLQSAFILCKK